MLQAAVEQLKGPNEIKDLAWTPTILFKRLVPLLPDVTITVVSAKVQNLLTRWRCAQKRSASAADASLSTPKGKKEKKK